LQYADNASPAETLVVGKTVLWHLQIALTNGQSYTIEFNAKVISLGTNVNVVNITGIECGVRYLHCIDDATVFVNQTIDPLVADAHGPYTGNVGQSISFIGSAAGGVPAYTYTWDFDNDGSYDDGVGTNPTNSWNSAGTYPIKIKVVDSLGTNDTDSAQVTITTPNTPPNKPSTPTGPVSGKTGKQLTYSSNAVDTDGDQVYLMFDWGDGNTSGWLGPFNSGTSHNASHSWATKGSYSIKVKSRDTKGEESSWSNSFTVTITKSISVEYPSILEKILGRFPALENILTIISNMMYKLRMSALD
jgi:hypothetical protein